MLLELRARQKWIELQMELATFTAWQTARMTTYGGKTLKPLSVWIKELKSGPPRPQTTDEMLAALRAVKATMGG